jgi:hypothetical protein
LAFVWQEGSLREFSQRFAPIVIPGQKIQIGELVVTIKRPNAPGNAESYGGVTTDPDPWSACAES